MLGGWLISKGISQFMKRLEVIVGVWTSYKCLQWKGNYDKMSREYYDFKVIVCVYMCRARS